jgi:hypothetical protein
MRSLREAAGGAESARLAAVRHVDDVMDVLDISCRRRRS